MITDGIELFQLFERETPDGQTTYLVGMLGSAAVAIVPDDARPGVWRVLLSDPTAGSRHRGASLARSLAPPEPHHMGEMDDDLTDADFDSLLADVSTDASPAPARPADDPDVTEPPGAQPQ